MPPVMRSRRDKSDDSRPRRCRAAIIYPGAWLNRVAAAPDYSRCCWIRKFLWKFDALLADEIRTGRDVDRRSRQAPKQTTAWFGVRNYQARNYMRDGMRVGDQRVLLSLELSGTGHCRHRRSFGARVSGRDAVRPQEPVFRSEGHARGAALVQRRREVGREDAADLPRGTARASPRWPISSRCSAATGFPSRRWNLPTGSGCASSRQRSPEAKMDASLIAAFVALGCVIGFLAGLLGIGGDDDHGADPHDPVHA